MVLSVRTGKRRLHSATTYIAPLDNLVAFFLSIRTQKILLRTGLTFLFKHLALVIV